MIEVRCISDDDPLEFNVVVPRRKGESRHHVTMARETYEQLRIDSFGSRSRRNRNAASRQRSGVYSLAVAELGEARCRGGASGLGVGAP